MGLQVFGRGKAGEVILHDQRPDGTAILLVCQEFAGPGGSATAPAPPDEVGVGVASSRDGGIFPMLDESGVANRKFRLHLDTTAMPGGVIKFGMENFTRRALQAADEGYREVRLTTENAEEWGWQESMAAADYTPPERLDAREEPQSAEEPVPAKDTVSARPPRPRRGTPTTEP